MRSPLRPRRLCLSLGSSWVMLGLLCPTWVQAQPGWDFVPRPLDRIPGGVVVGGDRVEGWSHPILFVRGKLTSGDLDRVNSTVEKYAEMFNLVLLAHVAPAADGGFALQKVAIGFSTPIGGRNVVITTDTHRQLGANLGLIGGSVFSGNEAALADTQQTARYSHGMVIDAPTLMLRGEAHVLVMARYFVWVSKKTGEVGVLVWAMEDSDGGGDFRMLPQAPQLLSPNMHEDRNMHVDGEEFNFMGIPSKTAFAVEQLPRGVDVPFDAELARAASVRSFDREKYVRLLQLVAQAVGRVNSQPNAR